MFQNGQTRISKHLAVAFCLSASALFGQAFPASGGKVAGKPMFASIKGDVPGPKTRTIPHWSFRVTDPTNGVTYPITMVGADPASGASTLIRTEIIPLRIRFSNGAIQDGSNRVAAVQASPIFSTFTYSQDMANGDSGQYGDVFMRAQFNNFTGGYHVNLTSPTVLGTVVIDVPQNQGRGIPGIGLVDFAWFASRLQNLLGQLHIDETTLPVFLTDNVMLYDGSIDNCCIIGYHGGSNSGNSNGAAQVQTMVFASYTTPGTFQDEGIQDIHALSHEVAEWLDDPFVNNAVQPWLTPTAPQYGCTPVLETGDPVVGIWFPLGGNPDPSPLANGVWHPEDEVFWPWFLRLNPSSSYLGHYTFMGSLNTFPGFHAPATGCN